MAPNDRLRTLIAEADLTIDEIAERLQINRRTVERWIDEGRLPYGRHRAKLAAMLGHDERYIWPQVDPSDSRRAEISRSEVITIYPRRALIPNAVWMQLLNDARYQIDILVQVALFLPEQQPRLAQTLVEKVEDGAAVRILLGDPEGASVAQRAEEENIGGAIAAKVRNVLTFYEPYADQLEIRLHDTTLYTSLYRFDKDMIVNTHIYGQPAAHNPAMHLRWLDGGELFTNFYDAFDRIWYKARPAWGTVE